MMRKLMKVKRKVFGSHVGPRLDWHGRSLGAARNLAIQHRVEVLEGLQGKRSKRASHVIRLGCHTGEHHMCEFLVTWRPLSWWRSQQVFNLISYKTFFHPFGWDRPRKWEDSLAENWMLESLATQSWHFFFPGTDLTSCYTVESEGIVHPDLSC